MGVTIIADSASEISDIRKVSVGATVGTYAGPGAIAVAFYPKGI